MCPLTPRIDVETKQCQSQTRNESLIALSANPVGFLSVQYKYCVSKMDAFPLAKDRNQSLLVGVAEIKTKFYNYYYYHNSIYGVSAASRSEKKMVHPVAWYTPGKWYNSNTLLYSRYFSCKLSNRGYCVEVVVYQ